MWEASLLLNPCCPAGRGVMAVVPRGPAPDLPSHRDALRVDPINSELKPRPPQQEWSQDGESPRGGVGRGLDPLPVGAWVSGCAPLPVQTASPPKSLGVGTGFCC